MKRNNLFISSAALLLCCALLFCACEKPKDGQWTEGHEEPPSCYDTPDPEYVPDYPKSGYLKLYSNGVEQEVYEYFLYGSSVYFEDGVPAGMLSADGVGFFTPITEKIPELPLIENYPRAEGLDIWLMDGAMIKQITAYDINDNNARSVFTSKEDFGSFFTESTGELLIDITVLLEGPYFEELDAHESNAMGYAFIIK